MAVVDLNPSSVNQDDWYSSDGNSLGDVAQGIYYPSTPSDANSIAGYYDGQTETFAIEAYSGGSVTACSNIRVYVYAADYTYGDESEEWVSVNLYAGGTWLGAQLMPNNSRYSEEWTYVDFPSPGTTDLTTLQVSFVYNDPNGYEDGCYIFATYVEATYTAGPATAVSLTGPTSGPVGGTSSPFTASLNGTVGSNVTVTPSYSGGSGTFSPTSLTLNSSTQSGTFTFTSSGATTSTISVTNNGGLTNPSSISYAASYSITVPNFSFETPNISGGYSYTPTGATWTFSSQSGITGGGGFGFNASPPNGSQAAFIQGNTGAYVYQTLTGLEIGAQYTVTLAMEARSGYSANSVGVFWDTTQVGSAVTATSTWADYSFGTFSATATSHVLKIASTYTGGSDITTLVDNVRVTFTPSTPATAISLSGPSSGAVGNPSSNFTVSLNGTSSGITVTPSDSSGGGSFSPTSVTLSTSAQSATFTYTPASVGTKTISVSNNGSLTNPSSLSFSALAASGTATYINTDTSTEGTWWGVKGIEGYVLANNPNTNSLPNYANYSQSGQSNGNWTTTSTDVRALQTSVSTSNRLAGYWSSSTSFSIVVTLIAGITKDISFYFLDWDSGSRSLTWTAQDINANITLASGSVSSYSNGTWVRIRCTGTVNFTFTYVSGSSASVSAMMFDPPPGPATYLTITGPLGGAVSTASSNFTVEMMPTNSTGTSTVTVTPASNKSGTFSPTSLTLTDSSRTATFTYTPTVVDYHQITLTNNGTLTNPMMITYGASGSVPSGSSAIESRYMLTGPIVYDTPTLRIDKQYGGSTLYLPIGPTVNSHDQYSGPIQANISGGVIVTSNAQQTYYFLVMP